MILEITMGVRDEIRSGAEPLKSLARMFFSHSLHEIQVVLLKYHLIFCLKNCYFKNSSGAAAPSAPWSVRPWKITINNLSRNYREVSKLRCRFEMNHFQPK